MLHYNGLGMLTDKLTEPQVKKHLTAEERAMRRTEMARRRKNLSEKRNEEEKVALRSQPLFDLMKEPY